MSNKKLTIKPVLGTCPLKVAIVVEELTQLGGAERVLDCFIEMFPNAPIFTLVWNSKKTLHKYDKHDVRTSFIQKLPLGTRRYKWYLPLMPKAVESFDFTNYDLVLSVTSALVKGIKTEKPTLHICYCNTPTRYLWTDREQYLKNAAIPFFARPLIPAMIKYLQKWDLKAAKRPDYLIANSRNVQKRIKKYYGRDSEPIFVPVETKKFHPCKKAGSFYLVVSRIEPYKKVDLVIDTFKKLRLPLKIIGSGTRIAEYAQNLPANIEIIGRIDDEKLAWFYQNAIATIYPQDEDAGIVPLESMAAGRPVIAFARGGALESVIDNKTGILFEPQTVEALIRAIKRFQKIKFDSKLIRQHAEKFDKELFKKKIIEYVKDKLGRSNGT